jgi:hypothetical protein
MLRAITQLRKTDLYTLFELHVRARGEAVSNAEAAQPVSQSTEESFRSTWTALRRSICKAACLLAPPAERERVRGRRVR